MDISLDKPDTISKALDLFAREIVMNSCPPQLLKRRMKGEELKRFSELNKDRFEAGTYMWWMLLQVDSKIKSSPKEAYTQFQVFLEALEDYKSKSKKFEKEIMNYYEETKCVEI